MRERGHRWTTMVAALALLLAVTVGCGDDDSAADDGGTEDVGADADADGDVGEAEADAEDGTPEDATAEDAPTDEWVPPDVGWEECPLYPDGSSVRTAECAVVELPLRADEPEGPTVGIWVQQVRATSGARRGQVWFLEGGPGGSGADFAETMDLFSSLDPRWDYLTLDHRGVGLSDRLGCPEQEDPASEDGLGVTAAEWDACLAYVRETWGEDLGEYTTTGAARDLGALIELLRAPGDEVFVMGVSYGTYWAERYLQLFPDQATGVILDSIVPPGFGFPEFDVFHDDVGEELVRLCADDSVCSAKLGADPWAVVARVFDEVEAGSCPGFSAPAGDAPVRAVLRITLGVLLENWFLRPFIPAAIYRLDRCDPGDVAALERLHAVLFSGAPSVYDERMSMVLFYHVALSELWPEPWPDPAEVEATTAGLHAATDLAPRIAALQDRWPVYARDDHYGVWPATSLPILMLNGAMDPQTPIWVTRTAADHFTGAHQYFFEFPRTPHGAAFQSYAETPTGLACGGDILFQFLEDPLVEPDDSCLAEILPIDFAGVPEHSLAIFGTSDLWENGTKAEAGVVAVEPPGLDRARRMLRLAGLGVR